MSKKLTTNDTLIQSDNDAQLDATREIVENHDQQAVDMLRKEQARVNQQLKNDRNEHHESYKAIEAKANAILQQAHREGEIHVVERHRKTASFFYIRKNKIMMWSEGTIHEVHFFNLKKGEELIALRLSDWILPGVKTQAGDVKLASIIYLIKTGDVTFQYVAVLVENGDNYFIREGFFRPLTTPIPDVFMSSSGWFGHSVGGKIWGDWREKASSTSEKSFSSLITAETSAPWRSLISHVEDVSGDLNFYLIRKNAIDSLGVKMEGKKIDPGYISRLLEAKHTGTPIDLSYNREHNSLLIQDAKEGSIGIHLLGSEKEQIWRSFQRDSQITLPAGVFQVDRSWTMSCMLKRNCKQGLLNAAPVYTGPFKIWVDVQTRLLKLQYEVNGKQQEFTSPKGTQLTDIHLSDWFLFTMQREGDSIRFFIDGELFWTHQSIDFPSLRAKKCLFSMAGFFLCELRVWRTIRTVEELKMYKRSWLPHSAYDGLTGYWHLHVMGKENTGLVLHTFLKDGTKGETFQEPDLSGNGHHLYTWRGKGEVGDLNRETVIKYRTVGPFQGVMPLYDLTSVVQGIEIDPYAGKIYWVDELGDSCQRQRYMTAGSVLGHLPPISMFTIESEAPFSILSRASSPYTDLIIAHADRRKAMEDQFFGIGEQHRESHQAVQDAHDLLDKNLRKSKLSDEEDNSAEYAKVHDEWLAELDRIANEEERALRTASARRNRAIAQAKEMTDTAQRRVIQHRKKRE